MRKTTLACTVLFADVVGSTRLYDALGNGQAQLVISGCLNQLSDIVRHHGGTVIKSIGDEIMCRFDSADNAAWAACAMQECVSGAQNNNSRLSVPIHIGFHYGPAISESGDLFGDAVNVASRMTSIAMEGQIITTEETASQLSPELSPKVREYDRVTVKGKHRQLCVYEVIWQEDDVTRIGTALSKRRSPLSSELTLRYRNTKLLMRPDSEGIVLGRANHCDLVMDTDLASRNHARLEYRRGKFVLTDQSTNGTYVCLEDGKELYLRREALPLWGKGIISLGQSVARAPKETLLHFGCK